MMKKNGFTLAEVLITLAIIGVVATMTLPALMTNTQEQQAKTAYKKAINTLTEAAQLSLAINGFDYSQMKNGYGKITEYGENDMSLVALLATNAAVDFGKSKESVIKNEAFSSGQTVYLRDGSALVFPTGENITDTDYAVTQTDGLPKGFTILLDINADKAPNTLSNCAGMVTGQIDTDSLLGGNEATDDAPTEGGDEVTITAPTASDVSCAKGNRVIKDQFLIKLRGNVAQPDGAAATWVYEN